MAKQAVKEHSGGAAKAKVHDESGREPDVTWGYVDSYSVDEKRLMIKLVTGAIGHSLVTIAADAPHFRTAVSMTMMAYHTPKTKLTVRYTRPDLGPRLRDLGILVAVEIGIGSDPEKTLSFDDWKIEFKPDR